MLTCKNCCLMQNCKMAGQVCGDFMPDVVIDWARYIYTRKEVEEYAYLAGKIWPDCSDAHLADYAKYIRTILVLDEKVIS